MGQSEIITALQNLGGKAFLRDLETEYFKLLYPPKFYGENYVKEKTRYYPGYKVMGRYLFSLKKTQIIKTEKIEKSKQEYEKDMEVRIKEYGTARGTLKKKTLITLLV